MSSEASTSNKVAPGIKIPELLAPAGSFEKMVAAIHYGADAVYCGGKKYSLRAHASNFSDEQMAEAVAYAHERDVKLYVTVNIFAHREDLQGLEKYLLFLKDIQVDGIIISDPGILSLAKEIIPEIPVHLSTQANVTNPANAKFWEAQGVARLNVARELSLTEIAEIRQVLHETTLVEVFVHGALCISYSGRCMLSYYFTGRVPVGVCSVIISRAGMPTGANVPTPAATSMFCRKRKGRTNIFLWRRMSTVHIYLIPRTCAC
jgi:putative protease